MNVLKRRNNKCVLCTNHDEEDLMLLTRAIGKTAPSLNFLGNDGKLG